MTGTNLIIGAVIHGDVEPPETTYYCDWTWQESIRWIDLRDLTTAKDPVWLRAAACSCPEFVAAVHRIPAGIGDHDLAEQCRRGDRMDRIRLRPIPGSSWSAPRRPADDRVLLTVPRSELLCRHAIMGHHGAGARHLPAPASGQPIDYWLALQRLRLGAQPGRDPVR